MLILRRHVIFVRLEHMRGPVLRHVMFVHKVTVTKTGIHRLDANDASQVNFHLVATVAALTAQVATAIVTRTHQHRVILLRLCVQQDHILPRAH